ncbi:MAG TPA: hypothetical protein VIU29_05505 [Candidatus Deferrimicrobiaceae bacterium]
MRVVGVMPMAGNGSRLGVPFHKALTPIPTGMNEIWPLWRFAHDRLSVITDDIVSVVSPEGMVDPCMRDVPGKVVKHTGTESPSSIAYGAQASRADWLAMVFPDTIWQPRDALGKAYEEMLRYPEAEGILACWQAPGTMLDQVIVDRNGWVEHISQKHAERTERVTGWGAFIIRRPAAAIFSDTGFISDNLARLRLRTISFPGGIYDDVGTPEQYRRALERWA